MKTLVQDYIFDKTNRRVVFTGFGPSALEEILLITNVTTGDIVYNFADKLRGGTLDKNVLTLIFDTAQMNDSDKLQIFIESSDYHEHVMNMLSTLTRQATYARDSGDRMRVLLDNNPMLYTYNRNSSTSLNTGAYELFYSANSWNAVDGRETIMEQNKSNMMNRMSRWTRT